MITDALKKIDAGDMYQAIFEFPDQLADSMRIGESIELQHEYQGINNIVVAGMGGSAIGGDVANMLVGNKLTIPLQVVRNYHLPSWVNSSTLVICSSYSGNTEETLSVYQDAKTKGFLLGDNGRIRSTPSAVRVRAVVVIGIHDDRETDFFHVTHAGDHPGTVLGFSDGWQQDRRQDGHNGNDNQKFYESKARSAKPVTPHMTSSTI